MRVQSDLRSRPVQTPVEKKWIGFEWSFRGDSGEVTAVSFPQAVERAKVAWLRQHNIGPQSRNFKAEMHNLHDSPFRLKLNVESFNRFLALYKSFQQGEINAEGKADLRQFQSIIQSKEVHNEHHFPER